MKHVIFGIHGLNNKVEKDYLAIWWKICLHQALRNAGLTNLPFRFELIYWADLLYPSPLDPGLTNKADSRYLSFPFKYLPPSSIDPKNGTRLRRITRNGIEKITEFIMQSDSIYQNLEDLSDKFIYNHFRDLYVYMNNDKGYKEARSTNVRKAIFDRLYQTLSPFKSEKIMIIAHSMGSIIIYDFLNSHSQDIKIDTLVTVGSPLGQSTVMGRLTGHNPVKKKLQTPENVERWYNLSDIRDMITINYNLQDDFTPNSRNIQPHDFLVNNNYIWEGKANPHSIFGYLQTPQCGHILFDFLVKDLSSWKLALLKYYQSFQDHILQRERNMLKRIPTREETEKEAEKAPSTSEDKVKEQLKS